MLGVYRDTAGHKYSVNNGFEFELLNKFILGDITGDEKLDTKDALKAVAFAKKSVDPKSDDEFKAADVNGDGKLDSKDAMVIINAVKNKKTITLK